MKETKAHPRAARDETLIFSREEYRERFRRVREILTYREIDLLYVTSPPNLFYLTGYELIWYDECPVSGLALRQDSDEFLLFDAKSHQEQIVQETIVSEGVFLDPESGLEQVIDELDSRGLLKGTVAFEDWSWTPSAVTRAEMRSAMQARGATVVDGSWIVDDTRLVKSPRELEYVRKAASIADAAMEAAREAIVPGATEIEIEGEIQYRMAKLGGEDPGIRHMVHSGPRSAFFHAASSRRPVQPGDIVWIDFCASYNRYHADLGRTFSMGEPDPRRVELLHRAVGSLSQLQQQLKPGDPMPRAQEIADRYIDEAGLRDSIWFVGGYDLGIGIPPNWVGHVYLGRETYLQQPDAKPYHYRPGMVTNYENIFSFPDERWGGGYIDTITMTEGGLEVLSKLTRELTVV
jgi:Xaa-Pro aminopeptidase